MTSIKKIIIAGNHLGIVQLMKAIPRKHISAVIVPYNRPESINILKIICFVRQIPMLIHYKNFTSDYFDFLKKIKNLEANILISNSYPLIFKDDLISIFDYNTFNIHTSLLPKNRGSEPLNWAIMRGETRTGITIHKIAPKVDAGDIIFQQEIEIDFKDTWITLYEKIAKEKVELIKNKVNDILENNFIPCKQDEKKITTNRKITEKDLLIDFSKMSQLEIYNLIRANVSPAKPAYFYKADKKIKFKNFVEYDKIYNYT